MGNKHTAVSAGVKHRRLCIYFFYDPDGMVDAYVLDCLKEMALHSERILLVSNSHLTPASKKLLRQVHGLEFTERFNVGFDVWAYKHGIETIGWGDLVTYDEVVFMNFTIVGPLYPFKEMFVTMEGRAVDFWGINVHSGESYDPWGTMPDGYIPKHIQSHFIAVRQPMLRSPELRAYWENMRPVRSYYEAIGFHEAIFTQTFEKLGFTWSSYIQTDDLENLTSYPLMFMPREVLIDKRCPIFKRKALILPIEEYLHNTMGSNGQETLSILRELEYDVGKIMPNILRTANQYDIRQALNAIQTTSFTSLAGSVPGGSVAYVIYLDSRLKYRALEQYLTTLIKTGSVTVIVGGRDKTKLSAYVKANKEIKVVEGNRLDFIAQVMRAGSKFDFVGILSFSSYSPHYTGLAEMSLYRHSLSALFGSVASLEDAVSYLRTNSAVYGGLAAPPAIHSSYGLEQGMWQTFFNAVKDRLGVIHNRTDCTITKPPLSSEAGMFLVRGPALRTINAASLLQTLKSLPVSQVDRVFNLMVPFLLQQSGGLLGYTLPKTMAENYITVLMHSHRQQHAALLGSGHSLLMDEAAPPLPEGGLYLAKNNHFIEEYRQKSTPNKLRNGITRYRFTVVRSSNKVRFDPVEGLGVVCRGIRVTVNGKKRGGSAVGAIRHKDTDIFLLDDPQYAIRGMVKKGDRVVIDFLNVEYITLDDFPALTQYVPQAAPLLRAALSKLQYLYMKRRLD